MMTTDISLNSNQLGTFWSEVLLPRAVREHARWEVLQAPGVSRVADEERGWSCAEAGPVWGATRATGLESKRYAAQMYSLQEQAVGTRPKRLQKYREMM